MHELSVTESIIAIAERHAREAHASRIVRITVVMGELSSIVDDSVQFYFDQLATDAPARGAQLVFVRRPVTLQCAACQHTWQPARADWTCPACREPRAQVISGREFYVESIEVQ